MIDIPEPILRKMYVEQEMTTKDIATRFGCGKTTVVQRLHAYGIPLRVGKPHPLDLPRNELYELYINQGRSAEAVAAHFSCHQSTVLSHLRAYHIPVRSPGEYDRPLKQCVQPGLYAGWHERPNPDLAYALGQLAADGNLSKNRNEICLVSTDLEMLDLFVGCLQLDPGIKPRAQKVRGSRKPRYALRFSDWSFRVFLKDVGLSPQKSLTIGPLAIPDNVFPDFLRGAWDGDGSWMARGDKRLRGKYGQLASGSPAFLTWVHAAVERLIGLRGKIHGIHLMYFSSNAVALGRWLYRVPSSAIPPARPRVPALARKYAIWQQFTKAAIV